MAHAIQVEGVVRTFGSVRAVDGLTFAVEPGEVFGVLGHNGAGKTTLVRLINGLLTPDAGRIQVFGLDAATDGSTIRQQTGVLTETPSLYERLTARDNLTLFAGLYGVPRDQIDRRVDAVLQLFNLTDRAKDKSGGFSKGMKQRLALARALVHEPQILFLDEPTAALDPEAARGVTTLIESLSQERGRTVFLATHNLNEAQNLCARVAILSHGKLLALGTTTELARQIWSALWLDFELAAPLTPDQIAALKQIDCVREAEAGDHTLAVQVCDEDHIPAVIAALAAGGGQIKRVNPREHSLEDIYFELQRREESAA